MCRCSTCYHAQKGRTERKGPGAPSSDAPGPNVWNEWQGVGKKRIYRMLRHKKGPIPAMGMGPILTAAMAFAASQEL